MKISCRNLTTSIISSAFSNDRLVTSINSELMWPLIMTSSNENISALLALCEGNSPVTGEFPSQRPVTQSFDVFFDLCWEKDRDAGDLRRHRAHYDVTVMSYKVPWLIAGGCSFSQYIDLFDASAEIIRNNMEFRNNKPYHHLMAGMQPWCQHFSVPHDDVMAWELF